MKSRKPKYIYFELKFLFHGGRPLLGKKWGQAICEERVTQQLKRTGFEKVNIKEDEKLHNWTSQSESYVSECVSWKEPLLYLHAIEDPSMDHWTNMN